MEKNRLNIKADREKLTAAFDKYLLKVGSDHDGLCGGYYSSFENPEESHFYVPECSCGTAEEFFREIKTRTLLTGREELIDKFILS